LTLIHMFGVPLITGAKAMGIGSALASIVILGWYLRSKTSIVWQSFSMLGASLVAGLFYWAGSGMETPLVVLLWVLVWLGWGKNIGLWPLGLLGIARPEGGLLVIGALLLWTNSPKNLKIKQGLALAPLLGWMTFRLIYYGEWLPNTYYAKMGGPLLDRLNSGWEYCYPLLLCWSVAFWVIPKSESRRYIWVLIGIASVFWGGGDWMWWGRLLVPFSVLLWVALPIIVEKNIWLLLPFMWGMSHVLLPYKAVIASLQLETFPVIGWQEGTLKSASEAQAVVIRGILPEGATIAINHAGFLPFFLPEYNFIDMTGLNDHHIAHSQPGKLHQKFDANYVLSRKPDAILFHRRTPPPSDSMLLGLDYWVGENAIANHSDFESHYSLLGDYWERKSSGGESVYAILALRTKQ
jgi:arabinofuranosyltransferase